MAGRAVAAGHPAQAATLERDRGEHTTLDSAIPELTDRPRQLLADQARQEQVWDNVSRSGYDEPYLSFLFRTINATVAGALTSEFGLGAGDRVFGGKRDMLRTRDRGSPITAS